MRHAKIAIVGVGAVGASTAYAIMWKNMAAEIILVDMDERHCKGEVSDLSDAIPFSCTSCLRQGSYYDASCADIIIIAVGARQKPGQTREDLLGTNWGIVTSVIDAIKPINQSAIIIIVTNPVDSITYCAQRVSGLPRSQVFGTGTLLDTQRLKGIVSRYVQVSERSIEVFMLGAHGQIQFAAWSCASIAGVPIRLYPAMSNDFMSAAVQETTNRVYEIIECKGASYYGIASCVADICECIIFNQRRSLPLSCYNDELDVTLSLPVIVGEGGIEKSISIPLDDEEQKKLTRAADYLADLVKGL